MAEPLEMRVYEIVGSGICVAADDGQKVYDQIAAVIAAGRTVTLSFLNVEALTSAFLNTAIGQLYGELPEEDIRANLEVADMTQEDLGLLKRVVDTAKAYFHDPERFAIAMGEAAEVGDE